MLPDTYSANEVLIRHPNDPSHAVQFMPLPSAERRILTGFSKVLYEERQIQAFQPGKEALSKGVMDLLNLAGSGQDVGMIVPVSPNTESISASSPSMLLFFFPSETSRMLSCTFTSFR